MRKAAILLKPNQCDLEWDALRPANGPFFHGGLPGPMTVGLQCYIQSCDLDRAWSSDRLGSFQMHQLAFSNMFKTVQGWIDLGVDLHIV